MNSGVDYNPKHMVDYGSGRNGHCCFAGCTPMGCPAGCCVYEGFGHRANCPLNPMRQMDEQEHDFYVNAGLRKHLRTEERPKYWGIVRLCPKCDEPVHVSKRICFGSDPHNQYRCKNCNWRGRSPKVGTQ